MDLLRLVVLLLVTVPFCCAQDEVERERRPFNRFVHTDDGGRLEVLYATYENGACRLTLYGALHIGDAEYYQDLQKRFAEHDRLLYELIAEEGLRPYPGMPTDDSHWISMVQDGMGSGLKLVAQFDQLDYRPDNFVHADMTERQWIRALRKAGSSEIGELFAGGFGSNDDAGAKPKIDLVKAFRSGRGVAEMRIMMAQVLCSPDGIGDQPTVIIEDRNEKCLEVLERELGDGHLDLAIFYGAAHMDHMERRLINDLGWKLVHEEWATAWDCSYSRFPKVEKGLKRKRWRAKRDLKKLQPFVDAWCAEHPGKKPTWDVLRKTCKNGKLPGRKDGKDEWGRDYELIESDGRVYVVCLGSDGVARTEDDLGLLIEQEGSFDVGEPNSEVGVGEASNVRRSRPVQPVPTTRTYESGVLIGRVAAEMTAMQYALDLWQAQNRDKVPTWAEIRKLHPRGELPIGDYNLDPWGSEYVLQSTSARWVVRSRGPDGKLGTRDDV